MTVIHQLTGYNKTTERVEHEVTLQPDYLGYVRDVFDISREVDPNVLGGAYPLPEGRLGDLHFILKSVALPEDCDWFLEAYDGSSVEAA